MAFGNKVQWTWECRYLFEFWILFPSDLHPEVGLLDLMVVLVLIFSRIFHTVFHHSCTNFHSPRMHQGSLFPTSLAAFVVFSMTAILTGVRWDVIMIWFAFPWWLMMLSTFSCTFWPYVCLLWKMSIQSLILLVTQLCLTLCNPMDCKLAGVLCPWDSPGKNGGGLPFHSPLEWVVIPFSRDLTDPGIEPGSPALQVDTLLPEPPGKPQSLQ